MISGFFYSEPVVKINHDHEKWVVNVHRTGLEEDKIDVSIKGNILSVKLPETDDHYPWEYSWKFDHQVEAKQVSASYKKGILTVEVRRPEGYVKKIPVR